VDGALDATGAAANTERCATASHISFFILFTQVRDKPEGGAAPQESTLTSLKDRLKRETDLGEGAAKTGALAIVTERLSQEDDLEEVTVEGDDEALEALFEEDYGSDDAAESPLENLQRRFDEGRSATDSGASPSALTPTPPRNASSRKTTSKRWTSTTTRTHWTHSSLTTSKVSSTDSSPIFIVFRTYGPA
jgi:hypothetical protein